MITLLPLFQERKRSCDLKNGHQNALNLRHPNKIQQSSLNT